MKSTLDILTKNFYASIEAKKNFLEKTQQIEYFAEAVSCLISCYRNGGRIYIAGNGGSAADAQHLAAEFVSKFAKDREPLPAEALTVDSSILTAIGNDYGYDEIFARQILGKMKPNDIFLGITTSGNSKNIIRALEQCKLMKLQSILLTGFDGGAAKNLADYCILASGNSTATIQELHIVLLHTLCEIIEIEIFG